MNSKSVRVTQQNVPFIAFCELAATETNALTCQFAPGRKRRNVAFGKDRPMTTTTTAAAVNNNVIAMPAPKLRRAKPSAQHNTMSHLTPPELLAVLRTAREHSTRDWAMILMAYRHGLRASEVCGLAMDDLDLKNQSVTLRRLKGSMKTVQPLYEHRGQPLLDEVVAIRAWLKERRADGSRYVFISQKGGRLDRSQFFRVFQRYAEVAGLPAEKRHPHCLKHSLGTHLVAGNVNLALVKQALGHRSINSTLKYTYTSDSQAAAAVKTAMADLF